MPNCPNCGAVVPSDAKFCPKCGAELGARTRPVARMRRQTDILGAVSAGAILIILAVTYLTYPIDWSVIQSYLENMGRMGRYIRPPAILFDPAILFFSLIAIWSIALSGLRVLLERNLRRAISDLGGGLFSFLIAFLLTSYRDDMITERSVLALLIIGIGAIVILNALVSPFIRRHLS